MRIRRLQRVFALWLALLVPPLVIGAEVDISAYAAKAEQAFEQGRYRSAATYLNRIVRMVPEDTTYRVRLGQVQLLRGKVAEAREQAQAILTSDASNREGLILMSKITLRGQAWEDAYGYLQALVQHYPDEPYAYLGLASVYSSRDDDSAAEAAMEHYRVLQNAKVDDDGQQ